MRKQVDALPRLRDAKLLGIDLHEARLVLDRRIEDEREGADGAVALLLDRRLDEVGAGDRLACLEPGERRRLPVELDVRSGERRVAVTKQRRPDGRADGRRHLGHLHKRPSTRLRAARRSPRVVGGDATLGCCGI